MKKIDIQKFTKDLDQSKAFTNKSLAQYTTLGIGGPADVLYVCSDSTDLVDILTKARDSKILTTVIGEGSNILISDNGIRGITIINTKGNMTITGKSSKTFTDSQVTPRWNSDKKLGTFKYEFGDLDYDESDCEHVDVKIDSGYSLTGAMYHLFDENLTGLQWFSGIPGTIGGAVFNNIHGGTHFMSEYVHSVTVMDQNNALFTLTADQLGTDYNKSRLHDSGDIIIDITLTLPKGAVERARATAQEWARRKSIQPRNSPGCAFANLTEEQKDHLEYPTTATGYVIEHVLKMTGYRVGDAAISEKHHNFIVNEGNATAKDYLAVMREIQHRISVELGITVLPEIFLLGFEPNETKGLVLNR